MCWQWMGRMGLGRWRYYLSTSLPTTWTPLPRWWMPLLALLVEAGGYGFPRMLISIYWYPQRTVVPVSLRDKLRPWCIDNRHVDKGYPWPSFVHTFSIGNHHSTWELQISHERRHALCGQWPRSAVLVCWLALTRPTPAVCYPPL